MLNLFSWDRFYERELKSYQECGDEGTVWFGKVAEMRMLHFIYEHVPKEARILDIGCAGGSILRRLVSFYSLSFM
jgi:2-polyprenyl-3-methyl-5-hydroxy-6-metoxy-1,4-benzoquinol methylase